MHEDLYTSGSYLEMNPGWHVEESPWKAKQVLRMMARNKLTPGSICEVGCGVGEILKQLQERMDEGCRFWGYDISPQALAFAEKRANERLHFKLADLRQEETVFFDLLLVMDVIEHVEDYFSFLREIQPKSEYKIFHIPLDLSVQTILRRNGLLKVRRAYGHIHYFSKDIALQLLADSGYEVLDYFYTAGSLEMPSRELARNMLKLPRKLLFSVNQDLAARILGGFRLLILAR